MDYVPEVILNGTYPGEQFGWSVSSAGDVNKDGYSDVIVGAPLNDAAGEDAGRTYVFLRRSVNGQHSRCSHDRSGNRR
jgi:hypothetical protein